MRIKETEHCSWYRQLTSTRLPVVFDVDVACCLVSRRSLDATSLATISAGAADAS